MKDLKFVKENQKLTAYFFKDEIAYFIVGW